MSLITVQELKDRTPDVNYSRYSDATVSGMVARGQAKAEAFLEYTLNLEDKTEKLQGYINPDNDLVITPSKKPVNSLASVALVKGNYSADITLTSGSDNLYDVVNNQIVIPGSTITLNTVSTIDYASLKRINFWVNITYNCGYAPSDVPLDISDAITLYIRDEFARTYNTAGARSISQGGVSITYPTGGQRTSGKSDFELDAERILNKYKNVSGW